MRLITCFADDLFKQETIMRKLVSFICVLALVLGGINLPVKAESNFSDIEGSLYEEAIISLFDLGLIQGVGNDQYRPEAWLTNAQAIQMYVNLFDLNLDFIRFIKAPMASDYFGNADNDGWYADAFIKAGVNGVAANSNLNPDQEISRQEFVAWLILKMEDVYHMPAIKIGGPEIADNEAINLEYSGPLARALHYGIISLDSQGKLVPEGLISRGEAASIIDEAIKYLKAGGYWTEARDVFDSSLVLEESDGQVVFSFTIANTTDMDQTITYMSSQRFDFNVFNEAGDQVYNWSSMRSFLMMIQELVVEGNGELNFEESWDMKDASGADLPAGSYRVVFESSFYQGEEMVKVMSEGRVTITD